VKKYIIELEDDLSAVYEDIAIMNKKSMEESIQIILKRVIDTLLKHTSDATE